MSTHNIGELGTFYEYPQPRFLCRIGEIIQDLSSNTLS